MRKMEKIAEYIEKQKLEVAELKKELERVNEELNKYKGMALEYERLQKEQSHTWNRLNERKVELVSVFSDSPKEFVSGRSTALKSEIKEMAKRIGVGLHLFSSRDCVSSVFWAYQDYLFSKDDALNVLENEYRRLSQNIDVFKNRNAIFFDLQEKQKDLLRSIENRENYVYRLETDKGERIRQGKLIKGREREEQKRKQEREKVTAFINWARREGYIRVDFCIDDLEVWVK